MNELSKKGAVPRSQPHYGILYHANFYQGIVSNRNPFRANLSHLEAEFYGTQICFIAGENTEISPKLTLIRRPGSSVYNSASFPAINRFYENRVNIYNASQTAATEKIQVIADTASTIYDATGPSTKTTIFSKSSGAGSTYFQSVGNTLYFSDGPDQKKYITPSLIWAANQTFQNGNMILDTNGNIQVVQGTGSADISTIQVIETKLGLPLGPYHYFIKVTFSSDVYWTAGTPVTFTGLTTYTSLNGQTLDVVVNNAYLPPSANVAYFPSAISSLYGPASDTGTGSSTTNTGGGGTSGSTQPTWNVSLGGTTTDGQLTWQNFGTPVYNWGITPPAVAPSLTPISGNRQWTPNAVLNLDYSILDLNNNVQVAINATGSSYTTGQSVPTWNTTPSTLDTLGGQTTDGTIIWQNCGPILPWVASTKYGTFQCILDSNQNLQICTSGGGGASGGSAPSWATTIGSTTTDSGLTWTCVGPGTVIITGTVQYGYSWVSIDGSVSTSSPTVQQNYGSYVLGPAGNARALLTGTFPTDQQVAFAWLWRTVQDGSTLFFDTTIPNPTPGTASTWSFTDFVPDTSLNNLIEAPINQENNPPPVGLTSLAYHLGCIWGFVGNNLYYSNGPLVTSGNGDTAWSPSNVFVFPSSGYRLFPMVNGLLVLTSSGIYVIQGTNTSSNPLFATPYLSNPGIVSYDAFDVNGSIIYLYTSDNQVICLDPSSGVSEVGFPIGDQFGPTNGTFTPTTTRVTWHVAGDTDKGLYVSDNQGTWWRMCPTPSPETGITWSPKAQIVGGFSCVQSVETQPGIHSLLIAPATSGPILQRDYSVYTDNGSAYSAYAILGSLVLAQPGQLAEVESFTTDSVAVGTALSLSVQLDEIAPLSSGYFETLKDYVPDPTELSPSVSVYAQRFYLSQTQAPAVCRHLQIMIDWGEDTVKNELLSLSVFGSYSQEK